MALEDEYKYKVGVVTFPEAMEALRQGKDVKALFPKDAIQFNKECALHKLFSSFDGCSVEDIWMSIQWQIPDEY